MGVRGVKTPGFRQVRATPEEIAEYRKSHRGFAPAVYRSECLVCGRRIWHSGIGVGSHRRSCPGRKDMKELHPHVRRLARSNEPTVAEDLAYVAWLIEQDVMLPCGCMASDPEHHCEDPVPDDDNPNEEWP